MHGIDLLFKHAGTTKCQNAQRVAPEAPVTPRVTVDVVKDKFGNVHEQSYLGNAVVHGIMV